MSRQRRGPVDAAAVQRGGGVLGDGRRQGIGVEPGGEQGGPQDARGEPGDGAREQHVVELAGHEHRLVGGRRHALRRRDEPGAHVREVAAEDLRRVQRPPVRHATGEDDGAVEPAPHGAHEREPVGPPRLPAGTGGEQHEPIRAGLDGTPGMVHRGDVGEHEAARLVQRGDDRRRRADARDDDLGAVGADALDVGGRGGVAHDDVRAVRRVGGPRASSKRPSHSSSSSSERQLAVGNAPMAPARHAASTRSGPDTWNIGAATSGRRNRDAIVAGSPGIRRSRRARRRAAAAGGGPRRAAARSTPGRARRGTGCRPRCASR